MCFEQNKPPTKIRGSSLPGRPEVSFKPLWSGTNLFPGACAVSLLPLDGGSCHLQIQKEGCGRARGPPALRKLGQSRLVTSLLMEAASSVWIFLHCRQQCKETSWLLCISMLIIWLEISLYLPGTGSGAPAPPSASTGLSPLRPPDPSLHTPQAPPSSLLKVHFLSCLLNLS